jgi:hypothetical protein
MALLTLASIAVRSRRTLHIAAFSVAALTTVGCSHNRQSYRPVFTRSAPLAAPCTNCGGSSSVSGSGSAVISAEPTSSSVVSVPSLAEPPVSDVPATTSSSRVQSGTAPVISSPVEKAPRSRLDDEPAFDQSSLSTVPTTGLGGSKSPPPPPKPINPSSGSGPDLQGPAPVPSAWNSDQSDQAQAGQNPTPRVRRASLSDKVRPYVDDSNANELAYPNKADRPWRYIVLHHSASGSGNYDQIDAEHRKLLGINGCGYHFVIGNGSGSPDGQIEVSQRWNNQKQGAHTRNARTHDADEYGIGICLVGDFDHQPPSPRQLAATQALIAYLSKRYDIKADGVRTHAHLAATSTVCPGKYFPSEALLTVTRDAKADRPVRATWKVVPDSTQR